MSYHEPISIQTTYTDTDGHPIEKQFRSLNQASKFFSLSIQLLKELSMGLTPKLPENIPYDLKVARIPTLPKTPKIEKPKIVSKDDKWHCDMCNIDIKLKSKYAHVSTKGHKKIQEALDKNGPSNS